MLVHRPPEVRPEAVLHGGTDSFGSCVDVRSWRLQSPRSPWRRARHRRGCRPWRPTRSRPIEPDPSVPATSEPGTGSIEWGPCDDAPAAPVDVECGSITVPLDYDAPDGRMIDIAVARVPTVERRRANRVGGAQSGRAGGVGHRLPADGGGGHARGDLATVRPRVVRSAWRRSEHGRRVRQRLRRRHHAARRGRRRRLGRPRRRGRGASLRRAPPTRSRSGRGSERTTRHAISTRSAKRSATIG